MEQEHDGGGIKEGFSRGDGSLEVLGEPAVAVDPGEEPLDHPAPGVDGEADLALRLANDLDAKAAGVGDAMSSVAAIGEAELDESPSVARGP